MNVFPKPLLISIVFASTALIVYGSLLFYFTGNHFDICHIVIGILRFICLVIGYAGSRASSALVIFIFWLSSVFVAVSHLLIILAIVIHGCTFGAGLIILCELVLIPAAICFDLAITRTMYSHFILMIA